MTKPSLRFARRSRCCNSVRLLHDNWILFLLMMDGRLCLSAEMKTMIAHRVDELFKPYSDQPGFQFVLQEGPAKEARFLPNLMEMTGEANWMRLFISMVLRLARLSRLIFPIKTKWHTMRGANRRCPFLSLALTNRRGHFTMLMGMLCGRPLAASFMTRT
jgi:hypothetical protein